VTLPTTMTEIGNSRLSAEPKGVNPQEYKQLQHLIEEVCGIAIGDEKQYLIESRLAKLVTENGCDTYQQFVTLCKTRMSPQLKLKLIDAMTTRETLWFRDIHPYETLKESFLPALADIRKKTGRPVRIWSAACSSGQEPYSIAMCVLEYAQEKRDDSLLNGGLLIKATDIAPTSITLSKLGRYDQISMARGLSDARKNRFFTQQGKVWAVNEEVKKMVSFEPFNLQEDPSRLGSFEMIFMRNVAIYFAKPFKIQLLNNLAKVLQPDGKLIIGSTESLVGLPVPFGSERAGKTIYYRKK
jgi:chemotaxis protein methyltransferase CheR